MLNYLTLILNNLTLMFTADDGGGGGLGDYLWIILVVGGVLIGFMFFTSYRNRKRQTQQADEIKEKLVVGVKILTFSGIAGTVLEINEKEGTLTVEVEPDKIKLTFVKEALHSIYNEKKEEEEAPAVDYGEATDLCNPAKETQTKAADEQPAINYDDESELARKADELSNFDKK